MHDYTELTVLVADDFSTMRRIVSNILKDIGFVKIKEAENGRQAFEVVKTNHIDLVVSDWNMPDMTGMDFLKLVRSTPEYSKLPVLLVTAESKKENIIEAAQNGASGYIMAIRKIVYKVYTHDNDYPIQINSGVQF